MGHEKRDCIALIGLVIVGLQRVFVLLYLLPFEVRGDGKHVGRYRHNRFPLASIWFTTGSTQSQGGGDKTQVSLHCRINLSPFTKDFRGGELLRVNCIFGASAHSRATMECQKQRIWLSTNKQWKDAQLVIFCICSLCCPCVKPSYYLASLERQSFLVCDGIQRLDMLSLGLGSKKDLFSSSRPISDSIASSLSIFTVCARQQPPNALVIFCICCPCVAPSYLFS